MLVSITHKEASYQETREALKYLQNNCGGAVITPLALCKCFRIIFHDYIDDLDEIRNLVDTYCALCNEYYLYGFREKKEIKSVRISSTLHQKYYISKKVWNDCLAKLSNADIIHYGYTNDDCGENSDVICMFDFVKLEKIKAMANEIRKAERENKNYTTCEDFWTQLNNRFNNK